MDNQLYMGTSINISKKGTFIDLSELLLDPPKKSKFKKFKSFLYKKNTSIYKRFAYVSNIDYYSYSINYSSYRISYFNLFYNLNNFIY